MKKGAFGYLFIIGVALILVLLASRGAYTETSKNMREAINRRDTANREYRNTMLSNSKEMVRLLRDIRDLLRADQNS